MSHEESDSSITSSGSSLRSELSGEIVIPGPNNKKHFFDYPKNVDLVLNSFYAGCVILAAIGLSAQFFVADPKSLPGIRIKKSKNKNTAWKTNSEQRLGKT